MAKFEAATGRYVYLDVQGIEYRVYFEEAGQGIPLICQHTAGSDGLLSRLPNWAPRRVSNHVEVLQVSGLIWIDLM